MRVLVWLSAAALVFVGVAQEALAHGGQYRMPGGGLPPGLREPYDPPPPPSPSDPPKTPGGEDDDDTGGGIPTPPMTPPTGGATPTPTPGLGNPNNPRKGPTLDYSNWIFWYAQNGNQLENVKEAIYTRTSSESSIVVMGSGIGNTTGATQLVRASIKSHIIPTLLEIMDPKGKQDPDLESAAYIALAKVTDDPTHVDLILKGLHHKNPKLVKESAAFACGMLRRARSESQLDAHDLDRVRDALFTMFEDDRYAARERGFGLVGVGLLGDQPSKLGHARVTKRLFDYLRTDYPHNDLKTAILQAISLQPGSSVTMDQRAVLAQGVIKKRVFNRTVNDLESAHCAQALGRIGNNSDLVTLARAFAARRVGRVTHRSVAIALGSLASRLNAKERVIAANALLRGIKKIKDHSTVNFARISLARLISADIEAGRTDVIADTRADEDLLEAAERGRFGERDFAALALGLIGREIDPDTVDIEAYGEFRQKAVAVLREGVDSRKLAARSRAAYVTGLGLARDESSRSKFVDMLNDRKKDPELRGYCANALGLIGVGSTHVLKAIRNALKERRTEELRIRAARALGMLRDLAAVPMLLTELREARSMALKGQVVIALANVGDERAVLPMVELVKNAKEQDLTRAQACAGLGILGDMEWTPSLQRLRHDLNYRAMSDLLAEVSSLL